MTRRISFFLAILTLCGCARLTTPNGGPQDKTAPKLVRSNPSNNEKNFKGTVITLTFDESIKLKEPKEEIIISPSPGKDVTYTTKQNRVSVEFKKGLNDNTTYSISFREAVQDLTEGNPAEDLRLAFSTGPIIDSLHIEGRVVDGLTEKVPQSITVAIYQADTFNIFKHAPDYFTKTDKDGHFIISNLKAGQYRVYAFEDKNKNLKLETKTEKFGFVPGKLDLTHRTDSLEITMVTLDARPPHLNSLRHSEKRSVLKFNKALVRYTASLPGHPILNTFGSDQSEIIFFYSSPFTDSLATTLHGIDSLQQTIDTLIYLKTGKAGTVPEKFQADLKDVLINTESATLQTGLHFNKPLRVINLDSVFLRFDSLHILPISPQELRYDTALNFVEMTKKLDRKIIDTTSHPLTLYIAANSFISIENDSSKRITKSITIPKPEDTATLLVDLQTDKTEFLVQLITTDYKIVREIRNTKKIMFKNVIPTDYKIRIILDDNRNNHWDPGNITKDIPPEKTFFFKNTDGKYQFPIRANWEVGPYVITF